MEKLSQVDRLLALPDLAYTLPFPVRELTDKGTVLKVTAHGAEGSALKSKDQETRADCGQEIVIDDIVDKACARGNIVTAPDELLTHRPSIGEVGTITFLRAADLLEEL